MQYIIDPVETYATVDEYLANFSGETRKKLASLRNLILKLTPENTQERIAYGIPTYTLERNIVHFGGYDTHISLYPGSWPIAELQTELKDYKTAKGTVQFTLDKPLPLNLIQHLVELAVERNMKKK